MVRGLLALLVAHAWSHLPPAWGHPLPEFSLKQRNQEKALLAEVRRREMDAALVTSSAADGWLRERMMASSVICAPLISGLAECSLSELELVRGSAIDVDQR